MIIPNSLGKSSSLCRIGFALLFLGGPIAAQESTLIKKAPSFDEPYIVSSNPGTEIHSLLTAGDLVPHTDDPVNRKYRMAGIPDGLGAYDKGDGTFVVLMNHEIGATSSIIRPHGQCH